MKETVEHESSESATSDAALAKDALADPLAALLAPDRVFAVQRAIGNRAVGRMLGPRGRRRIDRQPTAAVDKRAGALVDSIVISKSSGHTVFHMVNGEPITGTAWTDLPVGSYTAKVDRRPLPEGPDAPSIRWVFDERQVRAGTRFDLVLDGALPETLAYPDTVPIIVTTGLTRTQLQSTIKKVNSLLDTDVAGGRYDAGFKEACDVLGSLSTTDLVDVLKALDARYVQNLLLHFDEALKEGIVDDRLLVQLQSIEHAQASTAPKKYEEKFYVDNFSGFEVDPSSFARDAEREKAAKWNIKIVFRYTNMTPERAIMVYADEILDVDVKPPAYNSYGPWGLLYPAQYTKATVPRMWAAKKKVIDQIEEGNYQFILTAYAASQSVLDLVLLGSGMLTRTIPSATTGRLGTRTPGGPFGTGGRKPQEFYAYVNRNPRASAEEIRLGTFLDRQAQARRLPGAVRVVGAAESRTPGVRSGDYRIIGFDGAETPMDALQPSTGRADNVYSSIMGKTTQAPVVVVELGAGNSGNITDADALATARSAIADSHRLQRVIFVRQDTVIADVSRTPAGPAATPLNP